MSEPKKSIQSLRWLLVCAAIVVVAVLLSRDSDSDLVPLVGIAGFIGAAVFGLSFLSEVIAERRRK